MIQMMEHIYVPTIFLWGEQRTTFHKVHFAIQRTRDTGSNSVKKQVDAFWKRWARDVFPQLVPRKKWTTETRNVQVDDVVIVAEPNAIRGKWNIGRVQDTFPGDDGKVRGVKVKTPTEVYTRPITEICVLHPAEEHEEKNGEIPLRG